MTNDDLLYRHRVQLFALAQTIGVSGACRKEFQRNEHLESEHIE